ncbi:hypothetical protein D3C83_36740 [compost metagenome]
MNLPIGRIPTSIPAKSSSIPSIANTDPARNWTNNAAGAWTSDTWSTQTTPTSGATALAASGSLVRRSENIPT